MEFEVLCTGTTSAKSTVEKTTIDTIANNLTVYPNPFTNTINITTATDDSITLILIDMIGNIIREKTIESFKYGIWGFWLSIIAIIISIIGIILQKKY